MFKKEIRPNKFFAFGLLGPDGQVESSLYGQFRVQLIKNKNILVTN